MSQNEFTSFVFDARISLRKYGLQPVRQPQRFEAFVVLSMGRYSSRLV